MTYTAQQAREDHNGQARDQELEINWMLIRRSSRAGLRRCQVWFDVHGAEAMTAIMQAAGYQVEITHGGHGLRVSW